jgi:FkbM family methyltransferase
MSIIAKIKSVASNPAMLSAYSRWVGSKLLSGKPPQLTLPGGARIGGWLSFSEFWSFQNLIPDSERLFVERCLAGKVNHKATAFDIGANLGAFTCLTALQGHTVHSFEPIPETFCRLKNNVKSNVLLDRCRLNCLAVGRGRDLVTFCIYEDSRAENRMAMTGGKPSSRPTSTQVVATIGFDEYCRSQGVEFIDFLKIDVEGMEPYVMQGASALLKGKKIAAILIEICPVNLRSVGLSPADLYREFEAVRYSPYALNGEGRPGAKLALTQIEALCP